MPDATMPEATVKLAPSVLAADFARLSEQVAEVEGVAQRCSIDRLHIDVMDGHFVPNITMGPVVVAALRKVSRLRLETHLMVERPETLLDSFAEAGADAILVHQEGSPNLHRTISKIKSLGLRAGVVINPATPAALLVDVLAEVDLVLVMTVNPGWGGQKFIEHTLPKIRTVREMIDRAGANCELEVDGGIDERTAPLVVSAGATVLVAGSAIFRQGDVAAAASRLAEAARQAKLDGR